MTSSLIRGRPRRATSHISVRVVHTLLGGLAGVVWLVLPGMTISGGGSVPDARANSAVVRGSPVAEEDETSGADLVLPLVAVGAAGVLAGYGYVRRTRRARSRTTPGGGSSLTGPAPPPLGELDDQVRMLLVEADDCVRTSREELGFVEARFGAKAVAPFARAVRDAHSELSAAFRMRQQYDDGVPEDETARRHALTGMVGRCQEAGLRLDAEADGFDRLRALEDGVGEALEIAEGRFRGLAGRVGGADATLSELAGRYGSPAVAATAGHVEQAKDRLVFATVRLNEARQSADMGEGKAAIRHLRAAEGAITQADMFIADIDRLADALKSAAGLVPAALTGAEAELAGVRGPASRPETPVLPAGELHAVVAHADLVLTAVREELTTDGPYDPLDALRRIVAATAPAGLGRAGVLSAAALLLARSAVGGAAGFIATHRGAVGATARTRLAEAERLLTTEPIPADTLARDARDLAEQDVRLHGNPYENHAAGVAGAVLGGVVSPDGTPPTYGGPRTRPRRGNHGIER
ncbi:hypothetical protein ACQEWB_32050 [Streptomyces sp. CA-249302]|uniref:hypothetical protein n=1 Tax=Streptomyces sp. CA-249302 TaxID=3240058 RepID=UPI003D8BD232